MEDRVSAVLLDVDGTLVDTYHLYLESYRRALEPYLGYAPTDEEFIARKPSSEKRFLVDWIGAERAEECHASMREHYAQLHSTMCEGLYDGVRQMLAGLRSAGIPLGVVTGKGRSAWEVTVAEIDLGSFEVVVTDDDVEHPKPDPAGLVMARQRLNTPAEQIVYLGDSIGDLEAGRAAGMKVAAALWPKTGDGEKEAFIREAEAHRPDWLFERPADLVRTFAAWC